MGNYNVVDLFSGCGGFSYGFQEEGFNVVLGVDNWDLALETFKLNHLNSEVLNLDLHKQESIKQIKNSVKPHKIDVIIAGPPCQGFSLTGTRNKDDKRNSLFESVFQLARELNPKFLIIENVPGLLTLYGGDTKEKIISAGEKLGYTMQYKILYAPEYGVPQIRKRVFFVGSKIGEFTFPDPTHNETEFITCEEAIGDLPSLENNLGNEISDYDKKAISNYQETMRRGSNKLFDHVGTKHQQHVIDVIRQVPDGGNHKNLPKGVGDSRKFNEAWTRYDSKKPSKTIDTGHGNHFHYRYDRVPTVRENARLQSFPDKFKFVGPKTKQNVQVGNAVPPILGKVMAKKIKKYLDEAAKSN
jgi:DNA (cytosine-5)-methyltransferase 1